MGLSVSIWASSMMTKVSGHELMLVNPIFTTYRLIQWSMKRCSEQLVAKRLRKRLSTPKLKHHTRVLRSLAYLHGCLAGEHNGRHLLASTPVAATTLPTPCCYPCTATRPQL